MTAAKLHLIVDSASIDVSVEEGMTPVNDSEVFAVSSASGYTASPATLQWSPFGAAGVYGTATSMPAQGYYPLVGKSRTEIGITPNLPYEMPPEGWAVHVPPWLEAAGESSAWTSYSVGAYHFAPLLSGRCDGWDWHLSHANPQRINNPVPHFILKTGGGTAKQFREFVYHGFCTALVSISESNSFNPGSAFAMRWYPASDIVLPVSEDPGPYTAATTFAALYYGIVRSVATNVTTTVTLPEGALGTTHNFHPATIFFGGVACL